MSRSYANVSKIIPRQNDEQEDEVRAQRVEETLKPARKPRGTSPHVQVKVRRDIYEMIGVIAKAKSMTSSQVVEKILEGYTDEFREGFNSLMLNSKF